MVLLVQHHFHAPNGYWALPGRFLHPGEDDETVAAEECHAQTGIRPTAPRQVGCYRRPFVDSPDRIVTGVWGGFRPTPDKPEPHGVHTARWVPVHALHDYPLAYPAQLDMIADALAVLLPQHGTVPAKKP